MSTNLTYLRVIPRMETLSKVPVHSLWHFLFPPLYYRFETNNLDPAWFLYFLRFIISNYPWDNLNSLVSQHCHWLLWRSWIFRKTWNSKGGVQVPEPVEFFWPDEDNISVDIILRQHNNFNWTSFPIFCTSCQYHIWHIVIFLII